VKFVKYLVATGLGVGYAPLAPGTAGSLFVLIVLYFIYPLSFWIMFIILIVLFLLGLYAAGEVEKDKGKDPSIVVIDEIVGMGISVIFLPRNWVLFLIAFFLFRIFDIVKPPPIMRSQKVPGALGIMIDDVIAGIYTLILAHLLRILFFQ